MRQHRAMRSIVSSLLFLLVASCASEGPRLIVDLRTDVVPIQEFSSARVELEFPDATVNQRTVNIPAEDFITGRRLTQFDDLPTGAVQVRTQLLDARGGAVAQRLALVQVDSDLSITILITRDCEGVTCENAAAEACLGGSCMDARCSPESPEFCDTECVVDTDCTPEDSCSEPRCLDGFCFYAPFDERCEADFWCSPDEGCLPESGVSPDAGPGDGGVDASSLDAGPDASCSAGASCDLGDPCLVGVIECPSGECVESEPAAAGTMCAEASGECDAADLCDGSGECVPTSAEDGSACTDGVCTSGACVLCEEGAACLVGDSCSTGTLSCAGGVTSCVASGVASGGTVCRASAGLCDVPETCDGATSVCPPDIVDLAGTICRAANGAAACDAADRCDGTSGVCVDQVLDAGIQCRATAGACDPAEACNGVNPMCPSDQLLPLGSVCRVAAGECDIQERCTGDAAECPTDALLGAGTMCRASSGPCDDAEMCSGSLAACPADVGCTGGGECCTDMCVTLASDPMNCGGCGVVCNLANAVNSCVALTCAIEDCAPGFDNCNGVISDGCEIDTRSAGAHCGDCGVRCAYGEVCTAGSCEAGVSSTLQLDAVNRDACVGVDHNSTSGDDRMGIAVTPTAYFVTGDTTTSRISPDLSTQTALVRRDSIFADLRTGQVYTFTSSGVPLDGNLDHTIDGFQALDINFAPVGSVRPLSTPIVLSRANYNAIFVGLDHLILATAIPTSSAIYDLHEIIIATGEVIPRGEDWNPDPNISASEGWASHGIAERSARGDSLVYYASNAGLVRLYLDSDALAETILERPLGDLTSFTLDVARSRFVFSHENSGLGGPGTEVLGYCPATLTAP